MAVMEEDLPDLFYTRAPVVGLAQLIVAFDLHRKCHELMTDHGSRICRGMVH